MLATFVRFFPRVKATFDYGMLIFILTFSLISLSQFRDEEILDLAESRLSTVLVGGVSCILISIFVCPVWAGQDLHSLLISNLDTLSHFLQGLFCCYIIFKTLLYSVRFHMYDVLQKKIVSFNFIKINCFCYLQLILN